MLLANLPNGEKKLFNSNYDSTVWCVRRLNLSLMQRIENMMNII